MWIWPEPTGTMDDFLEKLREEALGGGAFRAEIISVAEISRDASFRSLCESNVCGNFGMNYMCPPDIGRIEELMKELSAYEKAMVYQTVTSLEDSYDFEGMMAAGDIHNRLAQHLRGSAEKGRAGRKWTYCIWVQAAAECAPAAGREPGNHAVFLTGHWVRWRHTASMCHVWRKRPE